MARGAGRNNGLTQPALPANCQNAITASIAIQPDQRPDFGRKPAPRNATGRASAAPSACGATGWGGRSSMLHLPRGVGRLVADQRPQLVLQREQLAPRTGLAALLAARRD